MQWLQMQKNPVIIEKKSVTIDLWVYRQGSSR